MRAKHKVQVDEEYVNCKQTLKALKELRELKLKPYVVDSGMYGFSVRVHIKKTYFIYSPHTKKWSTVASQSCKGKWQSCKSVKDFVKKATLLAEYYTKPTWKQVKYITELSTELGVDIDDKCLKDRKKCSDRIAELKQLRRERLAEQQVFEI